MRPGECPRLALLFAMLLAACGTGSADVVAHRAAALERAAVPVTAPISTVPPTTAPAAAPTAPIPDATEAEVQASEVDAPPTTRSPVERVLVATGFAPFASVEGVVVVHPAAQVERIGFHESGHDGARQLDVDPGAARPFVMETRDRGTGDRTAADIVVPPDTEIRVPVTGTVRRAGGYVLYCDHRDDFAVIEPDSHPGWEVKVFHIDGVQVRAGDRVEAGRTLLAPRATILPFESQVDEFTAEPSWPHVHVEIVDPSIPDRPSSGGGC